MDFISIGYGGRTPAELVDLLRAHGVRTVVDVRLRPDRASMGAFSLAKDPAKGIAGLLGAAGIRHVSLVELGNLFLGCEDWKDRYRRLADRAGDLLLERLLALRAEEPIALLCAEKKAEDCHRRFLADRLVLMGHRMVHVD